MGQFFSVFLVPQFSYKALKEGFDGVPWKLEERPYLKMLDTVDTHKMAIKKMRRKKTVEFGNHSFRETFLKSDVRLITMKPSSWLCRQPPSVRVNKTWVCFKLERSGHPLFWGLLLDLHILYSFQFCPYQVMGVQCELYIYIHSHGTPFPTNGKLKSYGYTP